MKVETFFEKLGDLVDAPEAIRPIRKLVLQLAISGRLVPQDSREEPARTLLSRIEARKVELAATGKLRQFMAVAPLLEDEARPDFPANWLWVPFGDIVVNRDSERVPVSKEERSTKAKTYDYYGASGVIDKIDSFLFDTPLLLIGEDGANLLNRSTPIAFMARGKYWVNNHAHVLDGICEEFLRYIELHINAIDLSPYVTGSAQPKMNQAKMNTIPIALPPLAEQKRIVAKVDELMALCDRLEAQLQERETRQAALARAALARFADAPTPANLDLLFHDSFTITPADLRKTILTLAVQGHLVPQIASDGDATDHVPDRIPAAPLSLPDLPTRWCWAPVERTGDVALGRQRAPQHHRGPHMRPYLRVQNVYESRIDISDVKSMNFSPAEFETFALRDGDLLLNEGQSLALVGRPAIYRGEVPGACFQNTLIRYRPKPFVLPEYALVVFRAYFRNGRFQKASKQTTNIAHLSAGRFAQLEFPIPPLAEQRRIVTKVDQLMALVDQWEAQLAAARTTADHLLSALVAELTAHGCPPTCANSNRSSTG